MLSHFSHVRLFATLWSAACQAPLSMGFSRQKYWSGLPRPLPGNPDPGIKPASLTSPALGGKFFTTCGVFSKLFLWSFRKSEATAEPVNVPSPPDTAETPIFWPLLPEGAVKPPACTGAGGHLQITAAKWIALTKCNVL